MHDVKQLPEKAEHILIWLTPGSQLVVDLVPDGHHLVVSGLKVSVLPAVWTSEWNRLQAQSGRANLVLDFAESFEDLPGCTLEGVAV